VKLPPRPSGGPVMQRVLLIPLILLILAACSSAPAARSVPTLQSFTVALPATLDWLRPVFAACTLETGAAIRTEVLPETPDLVLQWGAPAELPAFHALLVSDDLVVVVHPQNPLPELTREQAQAIFSGQVAAWGHYMGDCTNCSELIASGVSVWLYPETEPARDWFAAAVLDGVRYASAAHLAPDPTALRQAVAADPAGIGLLPAHMVDTSVRLVPIGDLPGGALRQPVVALAAAEPVSPLRDWLLCVQDYLGGD